MNKNIKLIPNIYGFIIFCTTITYFIFAQNYNSIYFFVLAWFIYLCVIRFSRILFSKYDGLSSSTILGGILEIIFILPLSLLSYQKDAEFGFDESNALNNLWINITKYVILLVFNFVLISAIFFQYLVYDYLAPISSLDSGSSIFQLLYYITLLIISGNLLIVIIYLFKRFIFNSIYITKE